MRIAVDALSLIPREVGGGETYLSSLLRAMETPPPGRGPVEVTVHCTPRGAELFRERGAVKLRVHPFDNRSRARRLLFEHFSLGPVLRKDGADVLLAPGNALPLRVPCPSVLVVQSLHSFVVPEEMSRLRVAYFRRAVPRSARRAARVICVSEDLRGTLLRVVPELDPGKVRTVLEGAPTDIGPVDDDDRVEAACRKFGVERGRFILFVSSLNPFKRPEAAVAAAARILREDGEAWPVLLAGRASDAHLGRVRAAAAACGATDLLRPAGVVGREDLAALYTAARVMCYPSVVETFGLPPLEAMACGCPVLASNRTSVPEVCRDAALLADPDDSDVFTAALRRILRDDDLRSALVLRGHRRVRELTWEAAAADTYAVLDEAAACR
ncbi:MAG: D-inositol-3-phosphate glycosyltransferase [Planctomycetes bacterium]|nr:D-inositol-3-phosphate glycosyltransferase [Planctomycetota bacterium]